MKRKLLLSAALLSLGLTLAWGNPGRDGSPGRAQLGTTALAAPAPEVSEPAVTELTAGPLPTTVRREVAPTFEVKPHPQFAESAPSGAGEDFSTDPR
jgi:hypothetical protein